MNIMNGLFCSFLQDNPFFQIVKHKFFLFCFFLIFFFCPSFVLSNQFLPNQKIFTIQTEFFEIIYTAESEKTASILFENADNLYIKATSLLKTDIKLKIPVVINSNTQILNAYYTPVPFNRIVLYDTVPDTTSLAVFSQTILSVFYHELVHAISLNIKSPFWTFFSYVFGDPYSPSIIFNMTPSFKEGVSVAFESENGEGRGNDGESLHPIIQSKIENVFPSWTDAAGARDIFPIGEYPYLFGGVFTLFLQQKYGMDLYAKMWEESGKLNFGFTSKVFKKVYGTSLNNVWNDFYRVVEIPNSVKEPFSAFPSNSSQKYGAFDSITSSGNKIAYISRNTSSCLIFDTSSTMPVKIGQFEIDSGVMNISMSSTGKYISVSGITPENKVRYGTKIFDIEKNKFVGNIVLFTKAATIVQLNDRKDYLAAIQTNSQSSVLKFFLLDDILCGKDIQSCFEYKLDDFEEIYSLTPSDTGVAGLVKRQGKWFLSFFSEKQRIDFEFPENIKPLNLSYNQQSPLQDGLNSLSMSKNTFSVTLAYSPTITPEKISIMRLPFLCVLAVDDEKSYVELYAQKDDFSGGVYSPVFTDRSFYFISRFAQKMQISKLPSNPTDFYLLARIQSASWSNFEIKNVNKKILLPANNYNILKYAFKGFVLPLPFFSLSEVAVHKNTSLTNFGFSYINSDPAEKILFSLGGGVDPFNKTLNATISLATDLSGFKFALTAEGLWTFSALEDLNISFYSSYKTPILSRNNVLQVSNMFQWNFLPNQKNVNQIFIDSASITFSRLLQKTNSVYGVSGFSFGVTLFSYFIPPVDKLLYFNINPGLVFSASIARLLPFWNPENFTLNWPISASIKLIPSSNTFMESSCNLVLFSTEIQKGFSYFPFYTRRFTVQSGYTADWQYELPNLSIAKVHTLFKNIESMKLKHGITSGVKFFMSPVIGAMTGLEFQVGADFTYFFQNDQNDKSYSVTICGLFTF